MKIGDSRDAAGVLSDLPGARIQLRGISPIQQIEHIGAAIYVPPFFRGGKRFGNLSYGHVFKAITASPLFPQIRPVFRYDCKVMGTSPVPPRRVRSRTGEDVQKSIVKRLCVIVTVQIVLIAGSVTYGYICGVRRLPGYTVLRRAHMWAASQPLPRKAYAVITGRNRDDHNHTLGAWNQTPPPILSRTDAAREVEGKLTTMPYLSGYKKAPAANHVTVYKEDRAGHGINLYTSGDAPEAVLMDMRGNILHRWRYEFADAFPDRPIPDGPESWGWWSRVSLYPNGDLTAIYDGYGLVKVDRDSNLIWATPGVFHHDLFVDAQDTIYCLTRETKVIPDIHPYEPVMDDFITIVDPEGNITKRISILRAFQHSEYAPLLERMREFGDLLHTNTIEVLDGSLASRSPAFARGNVLISCALIDVVAIVDPAGERVIWALDGQWNRQHNPTLLANGNVLLLDNLWHDKASRDIEVDPLTQAIVWKYDGTPETPFYTATFGSNQRLSSGNTLINESDSGRAFELTPENEIVWEFVNPARAGDKGELIATIFDFQRLDTSTVSQWLPSDGAMRDH